MTDRVRVGFLSDGHTIGGAEVSLGHLLAELPERVEATILATDPRVLGHLERRRPDATAVLLPQIRSKWDFRSIARHVRALRRLRPGVLHVSLNRPWGSQWDVLAAGCTRGLRVVAVEKMPRRSDRARHRAYRRLVTRLLAEQVTLGESMARVVAEISGAPVERVRIIPSGVPDMGPASERRNARPVIGAVGRLEHEKGHDLLLRALPEVPDVEAVIVGDGGVRADLERLADELGLSERVRFTGWRDDARELMGTFDLFVQPSRFEAQGVAVVEAMLAGVPVAGTDVGGIADVVADGETGWLARPEDAGDLARVVRAALADREALSRIGRRAREVALERYTAERMAGDFLALYDELAA